MMHDDYDLIVLALFGIIIALAIIMPIALLNLIP